jgi:predicted  nucleic acid-binding Zn-ribbon protein
MARGSQALETAARKRMVTTGDLQRTAEALIDEVAEYYQPFETLRRRLKAQKKGSQAYQDTLTEIETASAVLRTKAEHACRGIDEVIESLTD